MSKTFNIKSSFKSKSINNWIQQNIKHLNPTNVHICDGSQNESNILLNKMVKDGLLRTLREPNSYLACTDPSDVARVEKNTFISCKYKIDAGPTNNWVEYTQMKKKLNTLFYNCMEGKTMYVIPFLLGPEENKFTCKYGIQITDSEYVVENMRIMTKIGNPVIDLINKGKSKGVIPCVHSVGSLSDIRKNTNWPCSDNKHIVHCFPENETPEIYSYGSGYGGNALLSKKCLALRIASKIGYRDGWLAEHMFILSLTNPEGVKKYFLGAFPSSCGKTNMSMLYQEKLKDWKVKIVGDDIAWIRKGEDGRLYAINPENGFFGVSEGTNKSSNPIMMKSLKENIIYTNCAYNIDDGTAWWKGKNNKYPKNIFTWKKEYFDGNLLNNSDYDLSDKKLNHPNARFTVPLEQCPSLDEDYNNPNGVPISGIIFGGRRSDTIPLIIESKSWKQGILMGATLSSETTSATSDVKDKIRYDPFAMLPFCGYNICDYFYHWLNIYDDNNNKDNNNNNNKGQNNAPKIFKINVFRKENNKFIWPGFGDNINLLKWMFERSDNKINAKNTEIGYLPYGEDIIPKKEYKKDYENIINYNKDEWLNEVNRNREYLNSLSTYNIENNNESSNKSIKILLEELNKEL